MLINEENWNSKELEKHYLYLHKYYDDSLFNLKFGSYYSSIKALEILKKFPDFNFLEVGIGAGNFYRFLKINKIKNNYTGADLSEYYVNLAKKIHSSNDFVLTSVDNSLNLKNKYDIVYSRNVAHHQTDPYYFIDNLISKTESFLIIELKTRDDGNTNFEVQNSCQLVDGIWVPFIVLNYQELKNSLLKKELLKNSKITLNRDYKILGGTHSRFLEKELYYKKTKTAHTTIIIELNRKLKQDKIEVSETFEKEINFKKKKNYFFFLIVSKLKKKLGFS